MLNNLYQILNSTEITTSSAVLKLCLSLILGSLVGWERKRKGQIAGIRTFALISMGATLAMILSIYVPQEYLGLKNGDPGRIAAQVITGIGFLGAGAIIQMKGSVRGLTTAAGIWMVATIGMTVGVGLYLVSIVATLLILIILLWLELIERRIHVGWETRIISLQTSVIIADLSNYRRVLSEYKIHLTNEYLNYDYQSGATKLNMVVLLKDSTDIVALFKELSAINPTDSISLSTQVSN